jgi:hypothetical protein
MHFSKDLDGHAILSTRPSAASLADLEVRNSMCATLMHTLAVVALLFRFEMHQPPWSIIVGRHLHLRNN